MAKTITIKHVATEAGVSVGTVSRVLNKCSGVNAQSVQRVRQAIEKLNYRYNSAAQILAGHRSGSRVRTGSIGVVFVQWSSDWVGNSMYMRTVQGIEQACREQNFHAIFEMMGEVSGEELPRCISENKVDGLIIHSSCKIPAFSEKLGELDMPVIGLTSYGKCHFEQVRPDHQASGWAMAEYLWSCGHRKIAFVTSQEYHQAFSLRRWGYEEFMRLHDAYHPELMIFGENEPQAIPVPQKFYPDMKNQLGRLMSLPEDLRPTAIFAANDWIAGGIYNAARELGVSIPGDVSVVGCDNSQEVCFSLSPHLTSYDISFENVAYSGATKLIGRIRSNDADARKDHNISLIPGRLVERGSVLTR